MKKVQKTNSSPRLGIFTDFLQSLHFTIFPSHIIHPQITYLSPHCAHKNKGIKISNKTKKEGVLRVIPPRMVGFESHPRIIDRPLRKHIEKSSINSAVVSGIPRKTIIVARSCQAERGKKRGYAGGNWFRGGYTRNLHCHSFFTPIVFFRQ